VSSAAVGDDLRALRDAVKQYLHDDKEAANAQAAVQARQAKRTNVAGSPAVSDSLSELSEESLPG
jgi:hypothetical protein